MIRRPATGPRPRRRVRILKTLGVLLAVLLAGVAVVAAWSWHDVTHTRLAHLDLSSPRVTGRPLRVMQVTDVHDLPREQQRAAVVQLVRDSHPDLVALTGDLDNVYTKDLTRMEGFVSQLVSVGAPVYYVPGNHENENPNPGGNTAAVVAMLERHGVVVLLNRHVSQDGPWGHLDVVGTDDYYSRRGDLAAAMAGTRPDAFRLVLTHSPQAYDDLSTSGADLAICGHTHGGQVRLPFIGALYTPGGGFLPRLDKGLFDAGSGKLYIDSGVGQSLPLRVNDQSQVTLIEVRPS